MLVAHSSEAALLHGALTWPEIATGVITGVDAADWSDPQHADIHAAMVSCSRAGVASVGIDAIMSRIEEAKGRESLARFQQWYAAGCDTMCLPANMWWHIRAVREAANARRLAARLHDLVAQARVGEVEAAELPNEVRKALAGSEGASAVVTLDGGAAIQQWQDEQARPNVSVSSGFPALDDVMGGGFAPGNMVVVAARPSQGKSALALQVALAAAPRGRALFISLEMSVSELGQRMLSYARAKEQPVPMAACSRVDIAAMVPGATTVARASSVAFEWVARWRERAWPLVLVIDYLQLLGVSTKRDSREREVADISLSVKQMSRELQIPVVILTQLNRAVESRGGDKRPILSDIRESGSIEQDADRVILIHRRGQYERDQADHAVLIVAKNRGGRTGDAEMRWDTTCGKFISPPPRDFF